MKEYNVQVCLSQESNFDVIVEADSEEEAQDLVTDQVWNDELHREIRSANEITSEGYTVEEILQDFDIYDDNDEWLDTVYDQSTELEALEEYNSFLPGDSTVGAYAERR